MWFLQVPLRTVHPRWRGEHVLPLGSEYANCGSSPLARGTHQRKALRDSDLSVHPRWRGEHIHTTVLSGSMFGSSPLARGTQQHQGQRPRHVRFIPAGAGNTMAHPMRHDMITVHPRWRGEHVFRLRFVPVVAGSSPLARGTLRACADCMVILRFIPAGAGNTISSRTPAPAVPVHPRWRGEHAAAMWVAVKVFGSSPLARGTPPHPQLDGRAMRFIPAGAGNTRAANRRRSMSSVHPRWRGEHILGSNLVHDKYGSSPLARGTRG